MSAQFILNNIGEGTAFDLTLRTSWGDGQAAGPVPAKNQAKVAVQLPEASWTKGTDPEIRSFTFRDRLGYYWGQEPGGVPVQLD